MLMNDYAMYSYIYEYGGPSYQGVQADNWHHKGWPRYYCTHLASASKHFSGLDSTCFENLIQKYVSKEDPNKVLQVKIIQAIELYMRSTYEMNMSQLQARIALVKLEYL